MLLVVIRSFVQLISDIFIAPIWWYSGGLVRFLRWLLFFERTGVKRIGVYVWIKNIFVPMFGLHSKEDRVISFFVRLTQVIIRIFLIIIYSFAALLMLLVYLALPILVIYQLYQQIISII